MKQPSLLLSSNRVHGEAIVPSISIQPLISIRFYITRLTLLPALTLISRTGEPTPTPSPMAPLEFWIKTKSTSEIDLSTLQSIFLSSCIRFSARVVYEEFKRRDYFPEEVACYFSTQRSVFREGRDGRRVDALKLRESQIGLKMLVCGRPSLGYSLDGYAHIMKTIEHFFHESLTVREIDKRDGHAKKTICSPNNAIQRNTWKELLCEQTSMVVARAFNPSVISLAVQNSVAL
jgi:hypothetical protein